MVKVKTIQQETPHAPPSAASEPRHAREHAHATRVRRTDELAAARLVAVPYHVAAHVDHQLAAVLAALHHGGGHGPVPADAGASAGSSQPWYETAHGHVARYRVQNPAREYEAVRIVILASQLSVNLQSLLRPRAVSDGVTVALPIQVLFAGQAKCPRNRGYKTKWLDTSLDLKKGLQSGAQPGASPACSSSRKRPSLRRHPEPRSRSTPGGRFKRS